MGHWWSLRSEEIFLTPSIGGALAALVLCSVVAWPTQAHLPEYFGRKFVLLPETDAEAPAPPCGGDRAALREEVAALEAQLAAMAAGRGAYAPTLADPVGELGKLHSALCNHPAALDAYRRAVQLLRINEGLLTKVQLPYLRAMADSSRAIGDYRSAQATMRYAFRIHEMGVGELSTTALEDALAYFSLAREILMDPRTGEDLNLFFEAYRDNLAMFEAQQARARTGNGAPWAARKAIALSHLHNLYLILGTDLSASGIGGTDAGSASLEFMQRTQLLTFSKGVDLLEGLIGEAASDADRAELLLRLGNWEQWNDKWQRACRSYVAAWQAATGAGGESIRQQLSRPAELPEDPALWSYLRGPDVPWRATVTASFHVSARGDISRVDGRAIDDDDRGLAGRVLRWLRDSHARPAVSEAGCVDGELRGRRYRLL